MNPLRWKTSSYTPFLWPHSARKRHKLIAAAQIVATLTWPIVVATFLAKAVQVVFVPGLLLRGIIAPIGFLLLVSALHLGRSQRIRQLRASSAVREIVLGASVYLTVMALLSRPPPFLASVTHVSILVAAFVEEFVFRWLLPSRLQSLLSSVGLTQKMSSIAAFFLAQLVFGLCHFPPVTSRAFSLEAIAKVVVAGLLYSTVISRAGLGVASGTHGAMNLMVRTSPNLGDNLPIWAIMAAGVVAAVSSLNFVAVFL